MDSNDPANPNSNTSGGLTPPQMPAFDPNSVGIPLPNQAQTDQIISDLPQLTPNTPITSPQPGPAFNTTAPEIPLSTIAPPAPVNSWDQSPSQTVANPWDAPAQIPPQNGAPVDTLSSTQSPWPSSTATSTAAEVPTAPTAPDASNPFLQPQAGANFSIPQPPLDQNLPAQLPTPLPNPIATIPDPMNTAFNPAGSIPANPFAPSQPPTDPQSLGLPNTTQVPQAAAVTDPWGQPTAQPPLENPSQPAQEAATMGFIPTTPENPVLDTGQPGSDQVENVVIQDQPMPTDPQSATLDLSTLQGSSNGNGSIPVSVDQNSQPGNPTPNPPAVPQGMMPTENAPTDLSHLIAGEEQQPVQPMGNIYAPPVASDQVPGPSVPQTPSTEGGSTPPPEKHLNLTKVLLVAGIPIILVVAALSAYLILGVGKSAPEADTSLPVEQSEQTQAPLTNPPEQIVAPPPTAALEPLPGSATPSPSVEDISLPAVPESSPATSPTSAMDKLKARQSASPSPTPGASASESLPTN